MLLWCVEFIPVAQYHEKSGNKESYTKQTLSASE